jgi:hypothetical protein
MNPIYRGKMLSKRDHVLPEHIITERIPGGWFIAYPADRSIVMFGHGSTRQRAVDELLYKMRQKYIPYTGEKNV